MRILLIAACIFLAADVYADEANDAGGSVARQGPREPFGSVQQEAPKAAPEWAGENMRVPTFNDDEGMQPDYERNDEPSFGGGMRE